MGWRSRALSATALTFCFGAALAAPAVAEPAAQYASLIHHLNPKLAKHQTDRLAREVIKDAQREHLDARLLVAIVTVESRWRQSAVSHAGARGLGQLMPHTAHLLGVNPRDSRENLSGTSAYLARMLHEFGAQGERLRLAIAAYNAGPVAVKRAGGVPHNGETGQYVRRVIAAWHAISARIGNAARSLPHVENYVIAATPIVAPYDKIISVDDLPPQATEALVTGP